MITVCTNDNDWGNRARQLAQDKATGDYLVYVDDDDVFLDGALATMRAWVESNPGCIGIFQRKSDAFPAQPHAHRLTPGMVCPQNFLIPNRPGLVARWGEQSQDPLKDAEIVQRVGRHWSDVYMVTETAELQGADVIFTDIATGYARPIENPVIRLRYRLNLGRKLRTFRGAVRSSVGGLNRLP
jgi:glycosyltransferase involved in cell wall biosynthesis